MSTTLSDLNTRLNEVLKRSETRNLTTAQRERAINDALVFDVKNFRPWQDLVENTYTQAVDGVINIPGNFRKARALHYGTSPDTSWERYEFVDQTKFLNQVYHTATVTEYNDIKRIKLYPTDDQGVDQENETSDTDQGLYISAGTEQLFQSFTTETTTFKGVVLKLKKVGTISTANTLTVGLYATSSSLPTGSALATDTISTDDIGSSYEFYYFHLAYTTTEDTEYAIVLSTDASAADSTNYIAWEYSGTSQISDGTRGTYDGSSYSTATGDMYFHTYSEVFNFQYEKNLIRMTSSTSTTGLDEEFDEVIVMLAAARLLERQSGGSDTGKLNMVKALRYGLGGTKDRPEPDSAYGKLLTLWDENRISDRFPHRKMSNVWETMNLDRYSRAHTDRTYLDYL